MSREKFDVVVMGGGPGGSSAAALLARKGYDVVLLERERFPRFMIGESLLPAAWPIWDEIGVTPDIEAAGFVVKQGVNFGMFNSPQEIILLTGEFPEFFQRPYIYHVERARFDELLLGHARRSGADVREGWTVRDVLFDGGRAVGVLAGPTDGGEVRTLSAPMVVDATGRANLLARKLGWRRPDPALKKVAYFAHLEGAERRQDANNGSYMTDIHTIDDGWVWYIPLANDVVSVGAVLDIERTRQRQGAQTRLDYFERAIESCPKIREWTGSARRVMDVHSISNISYLNDCFVGDGFVLIGDASMFVDPIFSAGVTLAMRGALFASESIHEAFEFGDFSAARLAPYEERIRHPMERIFRMIYNWYHILEQKDPNNIFIRSQRMPLLRERLIILLSGGYDKTDLEAILRAAEEEATDADKAPA